MQQKAAYPLRVILLFLFVISTLVGGGGIPAAADPVSVGFSGWNWGNPTPQGNTLEQVTFRGSVGYAVGNLGTVLRSNDGGHSWTGLTSETSNDLSLVQMIDESTVIVGGYCTVSESRDGGASFSRMAIGQPEEQCPSQVASFSFLNSDSGFVEMTDGTILATEDGGRTFRARNSLPLDGGGAGKIAFISPAIGVAVTGSGRIFRTTNTAASWTQVADAQVSLADLSFVNQTTVYAVGAGGTLLRSTDQGATWAALPLALQSGTPRLDLTHISCESLLNCVMTTVRASLEPSNMFLHTTDGGVSASAVSWQKMEDLLAVSFTTPSDALAVGVEGAIVLSSDGGATFPTILSNGIGGKGTGESGGADGPIVIGPSRQDAYVPWSGGRIAATMDGGASWSFLLVKGAAKVLNVAFPTRRIGYAVGIQETYGREEQLFRTNDAGRTWKKLRCWCGPATTVLTLNAKTVLLIGREGVFRSTDSGAHFHSVGVVPLDSAHGRQRYIRLPYLNLIRGAELVGHVAFLYGRDVFESSDGGLRWKLVPRPVPAYGVGTISFVSSTAGFETADGHLFSTRDRGRHWRELSSVDVNSVNSPGQLSFVNASEGYALGEFDGQHTTNVLQRTIDGGRTWMPQAITSLLRYVADAGLTAYAAPGENESSQMSGGLFETNNGGLDPYSSTLTFSVVGAHTLSGVELAQAGGHVRITGQLIPTFDGASVYLSYSSNGQRWLDQVVPVAVDGSFEASVPIAATTDLFVQSVGNGLYDGAGTPSQRIVVTGD